MMSLGTLWLKSVEFAHSVCVVFSWHFSSSHSPKLCTDSLALMQRCISLFRVYFGSSPNWLQLSFDEKSSTNMAAFEVARRTLSMLSIKRHKAEIQPFIWLRGKRLSSIWFGGASTNWSGVSTSFLPTRWLWTLMKPIKSVVWGWDNWDENYLWNVSHLQLLVDPCLSEHITEHTHEALTSLFTGMMAFKHSL